MLLTNLPAAKGVVHEHVREAHELHREAAAALRPEFALLALKPAGVREVDAADTPRLEVADQ
eukprot:9220015-Pyramimonas_sp.AAC.1